MAKKDSIKKTSNEETLLFNVKTKKELLRLFPKTYNHDAFCKCICSILVLVRSLLQSICSLPKNLLDEIDLDCLEIVDTKIITSQLRANFFDMLYRAPFKSCKTRWVYFLIDFKSNNDPGAVYQLYRYVNTLLHHLWTEAGEPDNFLFPCVVSIIFHCGETKFTASTNTAAQFDLSENSPLRLCIVNFSSLLFDVNTMSEEELWKLFDIVKSLDDLIVNLFFYVQKITRSEEVNEKAIQLFEKLQDKICEHKLLQYVWDMSLWYFYTSAKYFTRETYEKLVTLTKNLGVKIMSPSAAETYWSEATIQGEARGIAIGEERGEARGIAIGEARGEARGIAIGEATGEARGEVRGAANAIIRVLRRRIGEPSAELKNRIMNVRSIDKLDELLDFASTCVSLGEFATALN
ncbi:MAG: Rpn family recombination-promoting nuclease/putative transposase [Planctomycetaceae bacterium]|jgi:hypothetical protein|nr:Rpn family recombination-promoting nuclease/putative transposase [Planctomycetaceae bacterium]